MSSLDRPEKQEIKEPSGASKVIVILIFTVLLAIFLGFWINLLAHLFEWGWNLVQW